MIGQVRALTPEKRLQQNTHHIYSGFPSHRMYFTHSPPSATIIAIKVSPPHSKSLRAAGGAGTALSENGHKDHDGGTTPSENTELEEERATALRLRKELQEAQEAATRLEGERRAAEEEARSARDELMTMKVCFEMLCIRYTGLIRREWGERCSEERSFVSRHDVEGCDRIFPWQSRGVGPTRVEANFNHADTKPRLFARENVA